MTAFGKRSFWLFKRKFEIAMRNVTIAPITTKAGFLYRLISQIGYCTFQPEVRNQRG
jgi:hypothetical protein